MHARLFGQSSVIDWAGYDHASRRLTIAFRETGKYVYFDVPATIFETLCAAPSAGTYFNEAIKGHFAYRRDPARKRFGPNA